MKPVFAILGIHIHIPSLKDLIGDTAGAAFEWITKLFTNWYYGMVDMFQKYYVNPPVPKYGAWSDYILGSGLGLARYLAVSAFAITMVLAFLIPGRVARKVPRAFAVILGIILAPEYFWATDQLKVLGIKLASGTVDLYHSSGQLAKAPLLLVPLVDNPFGIWAGAGPTLAQGGLLLVLFMSYQVAALGITFMLLPFFALSALYDWALKVTNGLIAALLVMELLGRPVALLFLVLARATIDHISGINNSIGIPIMINGAMFLGLLAQPLLFWACLKVVSPITGQIYSRGKSEIRGKVDATTEERKRSEEIRRENYGGTFLSRRSSTGRTRGEHGTQPSGGGSGTATRQAAQTGAVMLAKRYPATALAVTGAQAVQSQRQGNGSKSSSTAGAPAPASTTGASRSSGTLPQTGRGTTPRPPVGPPSGRPGTGNTPPSGPPTNRASGNLPRTGGTNSGSANGKPR